MNFGSILRTYAPSLFLSLGGASLLMLTSCGDDRRVPIDPMVDGGGLPMVGITGVPDPEHGPSVPGDIDGDGVPDDADNCPSLANADQREACTYPPRPQDTGEVVADGVARVNWYRSLLGLAPVRANMDHTRGCDLHVSYLIQLSEELGAPQLGHTEDLSKPYASEEGNSAGINSVLSLGQANISEGVDGWMNTLYHRLPLIHPGLTEIGVSYETIGEGGPGIACVQYRPGTNDSVAAPHPIVWPPADIVGTSRTFNGNESPCPTVEDPLAGGPCPASAAIPSLGLNGLGALSDMSGTLVNLGTSMEVPLFGTYFEGGPSPHEMGGYLQESVALVPVPESTLERGLYEVTIEGTVGGTPETYRWRFRTGREFAEVGCDDNGENRTRESAFEIETGSLLARVCDFPDMYKLTGNGTRTVRIALDHAEGDLDLVGLDVDGTAIVRGEGANDIEEITMEAGGFVQVYGFNGAMGTYELTIE